MKRILAAFLVTAALAAPLLVISGTASAQAYVGISVGYAPPPLPGYPQPICPGDGYIWTPGYWAWGPYGYYWVPGAWVFAPAVGMFWTPGYWAWNGGYYWWQPGYWGPTVGFYGGIDYGYGYTGYGYWGGYWSGGEFYYNRSITNVDITYIHNTYNQRLPNPGPPVSRVSYHGGQGGIQLRATAAQQAYAQEQHLAPTAMQMHQERLALDDPAQRFSVNQGRPQIVATTRPGEFQGAGVVRLNTQQNGYEYRGKIQPWNGGNHNAVTVEREPPQVQRGNAYVNEYRQPARPPLSNFRPPVQVVRPERPTPVPPARTRMYQPQPAVNYGNSYAAAPLPAARVEQDGGNMNRSPVPRPEAMPRAPIRQPAFNEPHFQARAPAVRPDAHAQREQDKPPHCCERPGR